MTARKRRMLPDSAFGLPGRRFPMPDPTHAKNAKARATQALERGTITAKQRTTIFRKADKVIRACWGR